MSATSLILDNCRCESLNQPKSMLREVTTESKHAVFYEMKKHTPFNLSLLPNVFKAVEITNLTDVVRGICIENKNKGVEVITFPFCKMFFIKKTGVTFIPAQQGLKSLHARVFANLADYLSFITLRCQERYYFDEDFDCYILNNACNFIQLQLDIDDYDDVLCYFPLSSYGRIMYHTLFSRKKSVQDRSAVFKDSTSLFNYLLSKKDNK